MGQIIFITGGTRSGKSGYAQSRAEVYPGELLYKEICIILHLFNYLWIPISIFCITLPFFT